MTYLQCLLSLNSNRNNVPIFNKGPSKSTQQIQIARMDTLKDHEIFHEYFFTHHIENINRATTQASAIDKWIMKEHRYLLDVDYLLAEIRKEIALFTVNKTGLQLERFYTDWENQIEAAAEYLKALGEPLKKAIAEFIFIKKDLDTIKLKQDEMMKHG
ncbi:hypothetical protein ABW20_dc0109276 [Dactylellina cionopaga]|nr:hypothetical protein ABW20_dc0109276 [Dactylellina cionopaga]